ncbi:hypothetical protein U9M48_031684 [Paspalum notatum var. saurae]|uniref:Uncharacterized protein n=1 Tax=Paspalum notatum var. saurae TaxID=547442 RepID=A0AAQ3U7C1_PASNO
MSTGRSRHGAHASKRQQKVKDRQIIAATSEPPQPYDWSHEPIFFSRADQWLNFDEPRKYPLLVNPIVSDT